VTGVQTCALPIYDMETLKKKVNFVKQKLKVIA
jgi:hypothetical protein